jgi:hypothetical protein
VYEKLCLRYLDTIFRLFKSRIGLPGVIVIWGHFETPQHNARQVESKFSLSTQPLLKIDDSIPAEPFFLEYSNQFCDHVVGSLRRPIAQEEVLPLNYNTGTLY